ncbi:vWA domain-containing protein [Sulfurimonas paralvinellae]|uniref:VWA domain-containing protein n=1 Tax=Sulfurimonas paralvinellae TaxID=317658 RepID=A0A7M1B8Z2_9BACT|nr:VWA domain-containing protein [Sulfurimonas paralvinellae]QOP46180.1 VWA domain-containing protein [Sulfurimonas paralvinellae]
MTFLNAWVLFGLIPIYFIYKKHSNVQKQTQLLYLSLVFMFLAMARPAYENSYTQQDFDSHDYIIALDTSYSMQATDLKPSRYELAKKAIKKLIASHPKDRFTLFAFTSSTLLISPPTTDTTISMMALDALEPNYILTKSTDIKNLFTTIAKLPMKQKNLIIFSDGGGEHDIATLAKIAKEHSIIPYIVATATQKGAALKKDGKYIKNSNDAIVISKINPILPDLANATKGKYYQLKSLSDIDALSNDLTSRQSKKEHIEVKSYKELFYIPLSIAFVLYFLSITKITQRFLLSLALFLILPHKSTASIIDFYHIQNAKEAYTQQRYKDSANAFKAVAPSPQSYFNLASAYYKAGRYQEAAKTFSQIRTANRGLKKNIYYNLGNCAVKLKQYDRAKRYYRYALALGDDNDALYNLHLLYKLHLKTKKDSSKMLPQNQNAASKKKHQNGSKKNDKQKSGTSKSASNQSSSEQSNGGGSTKKSQKKQTVAKATKKEKGIYKFTYKAYEKINKGYTDEKEPW